MTIEDILTQILKAQQQTNALLERFLTERQPDEFVSIKEAAKMLNCSVETIRRRVASGEYTNYGTGRLIRLKVSEIQKPRVSSPKRKDGDR